MFRHMLVSRDTLALREIIICFESVGNYQTLRSVVKALHQTWRLGKSAKRKMTS